ncbi:MAG: ribulose-phosphate 3-epimerase [Acidobacteria bacterium]|nr:ribulose-phosphate 3-epimerase [Acidobacteriota bacterium]MBV9437766.1 ribulose-phosphate 3-epimerase [Acidobacteriota bacterium]
MIELAPSILSADFAHLADNVLAAIRGGATIVHLDVMDGHFVPNLTIGPPIVKWLRPVTDATFDVHLMIENPDLFIPEFSAAGANWISVHQEACVHLNRTLELIRHHGCKPGVVINPATPVESLTEVLDMVNLVLVMTVNPGFGGQKFISSTVHKIAQLAKIRRERGLNFRIEVDGGISTDTVAEVVRAGAELLVAGSAVFDGHDVTANARALLKAAQAAAPQSRVAEVVRI